MVQISFLGNFSKKEVYVQNTAWMRRFKGLTSLQSTWPNLPIDWTKKSVNKWAKVVSNRKLTETDHTLGIAIIIKFPIISEKIIDDS